MFMEADSMMGPKKPQEPPPLPCVQGVPGQTSLYLPSVVSSSNSSRPSTPGGGSSLSSLNMQRRPSSGQPQSQSRTQLSPTEDACIIYQLKDKSVDELRRLLTDREAENQFLFSLDQVKIQNNISSSCFYLRIRMRMRTLEEKKVTDQLRQRS
ncbi:hypothetical protein MKX03_017529, partial [Papaver bracteatum]